MSPADGLPGPCLVIKNDGLGDLVLASGLIAGLAEAFDGELDLLTCGPNRELASLVPGVRRVLTVSRQGPVYWPGLSHLGFLRPRIAAVDRPLLEGLRRTPYGTVVVLRPDDGNLPVGTERNGRAKPITVGSITSEELGFLSPCGTTAGEDIRASSCRASAAVEPGPDECNRAVRAEGCG